MLLVYSTFHVCMIVLQDLKIASLTCKTYKLSSDIVSRFLLLSAQTIFANVHADHHSLAMDATFPLALLEVEVVHHSMNS